MNNQALFNLRLNKLKMEIESAQRQKEKNLDPLLILDDLMHNIFEMARFGLKKQFPQATEQEILNLMRQQSGHHQRSNRICS
jgi:hypothetical protein